jgi:hypothetical protein
MNANELFEAIQTTEQELEDLYTMSEEAACFRHNTDSKEEAISILTEYHEDLYHEYDKPEFEEEVECEWIDSELHALEEFYRMRVC